MSDAWPWLALAGLGAFHGLNPAMGWLFAVALGLHRQSRALVWLSLLPLAARPRAGHRRWSRRLFVCRQPGRRRRGLASRCRRGADRLGRLPCALRPPPPRPLRHDGGACSGSTAWSFLMATAHGAGLMLMPALAPLCLAGSGGSSALQPYGAALRRGRLAHRAPCWLRPRPAPRSSTRRRALGLLRSAWINLDWLWTAALVVAGLILLAM